MAQCQTCRGLRFVDSRGRPPRADSVGLVPCPECLGGEQHCCDGEQAQPEPDRRDDLDEPWDELPLPSHSPLCINRLCNGECYPRLIENLAAWRTREWWMNSPNFRRDKRDLKGEK